MRLALAFALVLSAVLGASAQAPPDYARHGLGEWLATPGDGSPGFRPRLRADRTIGGGWVLTPAYCAALQPTRSRAHARDYERAYACSTRRAGSLMRFDEDETPLLKTRGSLAPAIMLVRAKAGVQRAPSATRVTGSWTPNRPGGPAICEMAIRHERRDGDGGALRVGRPCDRASTRLTLERWHIEDFA